MSAKEAVHDTEFAVKIWIRSCEAERFSHRLRELDGIIEWIELQSHQKEVQLIPCLVKNLPRKDRQGKSSVNTTESGME